MSKTMCLKQEGQTFLELGESKATVIEDQREPRNYLFSSSSTWLMSSFFITRKHNHPVPTTNRMSHHHSNPGTSGVLTTLWDYLEGFENVNALEHPRDVYVIGLGVYWAWNI